MAENYNRNKQVCRYHKSPIQTNRQFATPKLMFLEVRRRGDSS